VQKEGPYHGSKRKAYKVLVDYDRTRNGVLPRWDERMLDEDIARVMRMMYEPVPNYQFAKSDCKTVDAHYTRPYSKFAESTFGYENNV
jgi:hypothetical protein